MQRDKPGRLVDEGPRIAQIDFTGYRMRVPTDRYYSPEFAERERDRLWLRTWQIVGRCDDIPETGDWLEYKLFDQSWIVVRGRDDKIRGFVNACRHRGNAFCEGKGHAARFTCPYHNWSYGLDGKLLAVARPDFDGTLEEFVGAKEELGLIEVPVETFACFIFLNPDRDAPPLSEFLGEAVELLGPYRIEEMIPYGFNVREEIACNWKVVLDAFQEGYHIQGVHPELVAAMDESQERYVFCGDHSVATAPFGSSNLGDSSLEEQVAAIHGLPATFPAVADSLPRFDKLLANYRDADGKLPASGEVPLRTLLQQAMRQSWEAKGLDVGGLTDNQLSDNHFWILFPNFFLTIHAGEGTLIMAFPHEDGDPNRCYWHVQNLQWFPPEERATNRTPLRQVPEGEHYPYFLALEQDYEQMQHQQRGLRNKAQPFLTLTRQEVRLAHYHAALSSWVEPESPH
ncbi:aromatic ring-hydroxylating oxygenase subunit alpha [Novosphingobium mangrovi (ex Huang et al. 2023)]|uniref:Aromatic ring-hydroxylating dioxygenase subunit alpha n=1 Tax=Novosphingobium mangrovi (ex Huang et al. 2023) TaxID=2976432 RepID=A0ABT2I526_9SPHN|nr:aromatic ring-hydroxylating dioxygenase subunit alpha [Novosphingobium mangrovi (ex Huang et al. 2023)]MCT2399930.1 aromatic ring-hydroxylating dioxygenase subunit alpha [Novosphingobium mangrovi (ex Huang et al. 2023)]